jgi:hypothetical protein
MTTSEVGNGMNTLTDMEEKGNKKSGGGSRRRKEENCGV